MHYSDLLRTETAITLVKDTFARQLAERLHLLKVSAPIAVLDGTGINDDLNGIERPVSFPVKSMQERRAVVVHSLAKWKRLRLQQLQLPPDQGILTDMRALRPDEDYSPIHSIYVDQWDWEKHILPQQRHLDYLKATVRSIYAALRHTEQTIAAAFPDCAATLPPDITFIHAQELLDRYPHRSVKARESAAAREHGAVFIMGIGGALSDGQKHDGRAPDYDDWSSPNADGFHGLNGDIVVWHPVLESAFELSSMGIRVDKTALLRQLAQCDALDRKALYFHDLLLTGQLPESIGGGIGQSRVAMFMLKKAHIGEVQVSIWPQQHLQTLAAQGVALL